MLYCCFVKKVVGCPFVCFALLCLLCDSCRGVIKREGKERMREVVVAPQWLMAKHAAEYMQVSTDTVDQP